MLYVIGSIALVRNLFEELIIIANRKSPLSCPMAENPQDDMFKKNRGRPSMLEAYPSGKQ
jgi:hypothetical protein